MWHWAAGVRIENDAEGLLAGPSTTHLFLLPVSWEAISNNPK